MEWWVIGIPAIALLAMVVLDRLLVLLFPEWSQKPDPWDDPNDV